LIDGHSGLSKRTLSFDRSVSDIFAIQTEIATTVTRAVIGEVDPAAQAALRQTPGTTNVTAYEAYLKGVEQDSLDAGLATDRAAIAAFDTAIAADPQYAQAFAARSSTLVDIGTNYAALDAQKTYYTQALADAQRAVALAPSLAAAQLAQGRIYYEVDLDFARARPFYEKAFALGQHDADIIELFAYFSAKSGRIKPALDAIEHAIMLDPLNPLMVRARGKILLAAGRYRDAIPQLRQAIAMNPAITNTSSAIGDAWLMLGRFAAALQAYQAEPKASGRLAGIAIAQRKLNNAPAADASFQALLAQLGDRALYQQAQVLAQWGEREAALAALEKAYATSDSGVTWLRVDPLLTPLRSAPRYGALLHRIGLA
jgi:tetratricopeptide (TPR) repeat protein